MDDTLDPLAYHGILPGTRIWMFDALLYKDDKITPLPMTVKKATVVKHYGLIAKRYSSDLTLGPYGSLVDVIFDHRPFETHCGHFTYALYVIEPQTQFPPELLVEYNKRFIWRPIDDVTQAGNGNVPINIGGSSTVS